MALACVNVHVTFAASGLVVAGQLPPDGQSQLQLPKLPLEFPS